MGVIFLLKCKTENYQYMGYTIRLFDKYFSHLRGRVNKNRLREKGKPTLIDYISENGGINNWEYIILFNEATGSIDELKNKVKELKKIYISNIN